MFAKLYQYKTNSISQFPPLLLLLLLPLFLPLPLPPLLSSITKSEQFDFIFMRRTWLENDDCPMVLYNLRLNPNDPHGLHLAKGVIELARADTHSSVGTPAHELLPELLLARLPWLTVVDLVEGTDTHVIPCLLLAINTIALLHVCVV